ncbi:MAG: BMP family protein [Lachnospiraceae bacterium]
MKSKLIKGFALVSLSAMMAFAVIGCGSSSTGSSESTSADTTTEAATETAAEVETEAATEAATEEATEEATAVDPTTVKVALILPGTINDQGWNTEAYDGLMLVEALGCQTAYSESVAASDYESTFRGYAEQGFHVVIGHGTEFVDAAEKVAVDFPETMFLLTSSDATMEPNVGSLQNLNNEQGFIAGVVAALASESHVVGSVGGMEIPSIQSYMLGFEQGVAYVDNGTTALIAYTGDFDDATKGKEQAKAFIDQGADVISHDADGAGLGIFEAVKEAGEGYYAIGAVKDQYEQLPAQTLTSATNSIGEGILVAIEDYLQGELEPICYKFGIAEGTIGLADYHECADVLTEEEKQFVTDTMDKIVSGEIEVESAQN